jgi:hypothetical protein
VNIFAQQLKRKAPSGVEEASSKMFKAVCLLVDGERWLSSGLDGFRFGFLRVF